MCYRINVNKFFPKRKINDKYELFFDVYRINNMLDKQKLLMKYVYNEEIKLLVVD
jgi:hypothetical protein